MEPTRHRRRRLLPWQVAFLVLAAIWGLSFWWIKVGLEMLAPVQLAFVRLSVGTATLALLSLATGARLPRSLSTWRHLFVAAMLMNSVPVTLLAVGETHVSSVLAGMINAATPLVTLAVILVAFPENKPTTQRILGLLLGFVGILIVVGVWEGLGSGEWIGVAACLGALCSNSASIPYIRRHLAGLPESGIGLATGQVACATLALLPLAIVSGPLPGPVALDPVLAVLISGALGAGLAYALQYQVIDEAGPSTASMVTYVMPLFAIVAGVAFLGEPFVWHEPIGGLVILVALALAEGRLRGAVDAVANRFRRSPDVAPD